MSARSTNSSMSIVRPASGSRGASSSSSMSTNSPEGSSYPLTIASDGTSDSSAAETLRYRTREPLRLSIWLNETDLRETALKSFTGMFTSPKLMDPLQMALGMVTSVPGSSLLEQRQQGQRRVHGREGR